MTRAPYLIPSGLRACAALLLCTIASPAAAQPDSGTVFFGAGALASIERSARASDYGLDSDRNGTAAGGSLNLGVYLTPRVSARFEWSMTDWLEYRDQIIYPLYARQGLAVGMGPAVDLALAERLIAPVGVENRSRSKAGFALIGYHLGSRRASVEVMGGMGWLARTTRASYGYRGAQPLMEALPNALLLPRGESKSTQFQTTGVAGLDALVGLTDHAAIVPQLRVFASGGDLSLRPGVGIRWTF